MSIPLVSVIIPLFNAEKHINSAIESVLNQSHKNCEIIVINDGSTDNSEAIIKQYQGLVNYVYQENSGASSARNAGLKLVRGEYIQYLDADDMLDVGKIETQLQQLKNNPGCVSFGVTHHFFDGENRLSNFIVDNGPSDYFGESIDPIFFLWYLWGGYSPSLVGMVQPNTWLIPRSIVDAAGEWDTNISVDDDGEYFTRIVLQSQKVFFCKESISYYRRYRNSSNNLSAKKDNLALKSMLLSIQSKADQLLKASGHQNSKRAIAHQYTNLYYMAYPFHWRITQTAKHLMIKYGGPTHVYYPGNPLLNRLILFVDWRIIKILQQIRGLIRSIKLK